jgi:hypothetical protein
MIGWLFRLVKFFIPASGFNTPPLGAVLNSAALLDDAGIKPAIQSIPIGNNHPSPLVAGWLIRLVREFSGSLTSSAEFAAVGGKDGTENHKAGFS